MRLLTIATGVLSAIVAVWCFANQGAVFASVAFVIGMMMLLHGVCEVCGYFAVHRKMGHASYILSEGASDFLLGILVLANCLNTESAVPVFFGMWVLFSGSIRAATALNSNIKKGGDIGALYMLIVGTISMIVGVYSFCNVLLLGVPNVLLISICFLIKSVNTIATGIEMPHKKKERLTAENLQVLPLKRKKRQEEGKRAVKIQREKAQDEDTNAKEEKVLELFAQILAAQQEEKEVNETRKDLPEDNSETEGNENNTEENKA